MDYIYICTAIATRWYTRIKTDPQRAGLLSAALLHVQLLSAALLHVQGSSDHKMRAHALAYLCKGSKRGGSAQGGGPVEHKR